MIARAAYRDGIAATEEIVALAILQADDVEPQTRIVESRCRSRAA
jgi:hypothetical protein